MSWDDLKAEIESEFGQLAGREAEQFDVLCARWAARNSRNAERLRDARKQYPERFKEYAKRYYESVKHTEEYKAKQRAYGKVYRDAHQERVRLLAAERQRRRTKKLAAQRAIRRNADQSQGRFGT